MGRGPKTCSTEKLQGSMSCGLLGVSRDLSLSLSIQFVFILTAMPKPEPGTQVPVATRSPTPLIPLRETCARPQQRVAHTLLNVISPIHDHGRGLEEGRYGFPVRDEEIISPTFDRPTFSPSSLPATWYSFTLKYFPPPSPSPSPSGPERFPWLPALR